MIQFRAKDIKTGELVEGYRVDTYDKFYIIPLKHNQKIIDINGEGHLEDIGSTMIEIDPVTLAVTFGTKDKNDKLIYASFECEGGEMSKGGDVVKQVIRGCYDEGLITFHGGRIWIGESSLLPLMGELEIIGNQMERVNEKV